jgi:hypothetical protein
MVGYVTLATWYILFLLLVANSLEARSISGRWTLKEMQRESLRVSG